MSWVFFKYIFWLVFEIISTVRSDISVAYREYTETVFKLAFGERLVLFCFSFIFQEFHLVNTLK